MVTANLQMILLLLSGAVCIKNIFGRSITPESYGDPLHRPPPLNTELQDIEIELGNGLHTSLEFGNDGADHISSFANILFRKLLKNDTFLNLFSNSISVDLVINIGISIAQALVAEIGLADSYMAINYMTNALSTINPGAGPEGFGRAFVNAIGQVMMNNRILNSSNVLSIANTIARIIINSSSACFYEDGSETRLGEGVGRRTDLGLGVNSGLSDGADLDRIDIVNGASSDVGATWDVDGLGAVFNVRSSLGANVGGGLQRTNPDIEAGLGANTGVRAGLGGNLGVTSDLRAGLGANRGVGDYLDTAAGLGVPGDSGVEYGLGSGLDNGGRVKIGVGLNVGIVNDLNVSVGGGVNLDAGLNAGLDIDLRLSGDGIALFQIELKKKLLKDKYFRYIFSNYIPTSALNAVIGAIAQYLSKAFGLPRLSLLPLEKNILTLTKSKALTLEEYVDIIVTTIITVLKNANIIKNASVVLQVSMAAKAISSGIANFLEISAVPGVGVSISSNSYNSFFSILNGLEKLPYVGNDVVSRKFPSILKTATATAFALHFVKVLFFNLVSSSRFYESFSLGVPASSFKILSSSLGNFMSEAFGSCRASFISDIYVKALLTIINKSNYKTYAKTLAIATAKALYSLGYFLSGNANIQAAIATNAIIRALVTRTQPKPVNSEVALFPGIFNIPLTTQLTGVAPLDSLLKVKVDASLAADLDLCAGTGIDAGIGLDAIVGTVVNVGAGLSLDASLNFDAGFGVSTAVGVGAKDGASAGVGVYAEGALGIGVGSSTKIGAGVNARAGMGSSTNFKPNIDLEIENLERELTDEIEDLELAFAAKKSLKLNEKEIFLRHKRAVDNFNNLKVGFAVKAGVAPDVNAATNIEIGTEKDGLDIRAGVEANIVAGLGLSAKLEAGHSGLNVVGSISNRHLSIVHVLPLILANKFYVSTAVYTSYTIVDSRNVVDLVAQAIAVEFGFPVSSIFLKSYRNCFTSDADNNYGSFVIALATATTDALTAAGILSSTFTVLTAGQLSNAVVAKFSSLIATSLESRDWSVKPRWTNIYDLAQYDPLLGLECKA